MSSDTKVHTFSPQLLVLKLVRLVKLVRLGKLIGQIGQIEIPKCDSVRATVVTRID